jgi:hypothetical protein
VDAQDVAVASLGASLKQNQYHALTDLDLSNNPNIKDAGMRGLAEGLQSMLHG